MMHKIGTVQKQATYNVPNGEVIVTKGGVFDTLLVVATGVSPLDSDC